MALMFRARLGLTGTSQGGWNGEQPGKWASRLLWTQLQLLCGFVGKPLCPQKPSSGNLPHPGKAHLDLLSLFLFDATGENTVSQETLEHYDGQNIIPTPQVRA